MRRAMSLEVNNVTSHELQYELDASPRSSLCTVSDLKHSPGYSHPSELPAITTLPSTPTPPLVPSIRLLFSSVSTRQRLCLVLPAAVSSAIAGGIAPFMTLVIGQVFNGFAKFSATSPPTDATKSKLLHDVGIGALELVGLAVGCLTLSSVTSSLWIWIGEHNTMAIRKKVYYAVTQKEMAWFDTKMEAEGVEGSIGAGGLMSKFTRCVTHLFLLFTAFNCRCLSGKPTTSGLLRPSPVGCSFSI